MTDSVGPVRRRRKSRRCRQRRRFTLLAALIGVILSFGLILYHLAPSSSWSGSSNPSWERGDPSHNLAVLASQPLWSAPASPSRRLVYGYSLVPGGVRTPQELEQASEHDPLLAEHYAGFDYRHAKVVQLDAPKLVYLSYRMKGKIYWTKGKHPLRKGEKLISDGKITARTRCANRVSESAQKGILSEEPPAELFEVPVFPGAGTPQLPYPGALEAEGVNRPFPEFVPLGPATTAGLPGGWGFPPLFPPPLPGACTPAGEKPNPKKKNPCPGPPPSPPPSPVPEPGTLLLVGSGAAGVYLRCRKSKPA